VSTCRHCGLSRKCKCYDSTEHDNMINRAGISVRRFRSKTCINCKLDKSRDVLVEGLCIDCLLKHWYKTRGIQ